MLLKLHEKFFFSCTKSLVLIIETEEKDYFVSYYAVYHCLLKQIHLDTITFLSAENNNFFLQFTETLFLKIPYLFKKKNSLNTTRIIFSKV